MATASAPGGSAPSAAAPAALPAATPPLAAVMLLSSAAMGYEVLLTRLFSIIQWHHFAYMMISVALLGYGAAGTFVALARRRLLPRFERSFAAGAVAVRHHDRRGVRARPAGRVQSAGDPLGSAAAAAPARRLRAALRPVLLRRELHLSHVHAVRRRAAPDLQLRHPGCGSGQPRHPRRALRARPGRCAEAPRRTRACGGGPGTRSRQHAGASGRCRAARRRDHRADLHPRELDGPALVGIQGARADAAHRRHAGRRGELVAARPRHGRGKRAGTVPARAGHESRRDDGAAAAARSVHRR